MKKILIVIGDITKTGGTERATVNLANILNHSGHKVSILSLNGSEHKQGYYPVDKEVEKIFLELPVLGYRFIDKFGWYALLIKSLRKRLSAQSFDIVIGTGHAINAMLPLAKPNSKLKIIACEHIAYSTLPFTSQLLRRVLYRFVSSVVVLTKSAEARFKYLKSVKRIPNSLPFVPKRVSDLKNKQILAIGRLSEVKGFDRLIKIAAALKENHSDWRIKIVGEGELEEQLKALCRTMNVESYVLFAPFKKNIEEEYLASSIYALTSHSEAFPMVFLEAKACGLPIVSYNCPEGPVDIINNGVDGYLVSDGDEPGFLEALSSLIHDESLRIRMGENAKKDSLRFSEELIRVQWDALIRELS